MKPRQYFPLGKAYGEAFCNRVTETQDLLGNIENGKHSFLVAPRRYGKSSLSEKAIDKSSLPTVKIDLHVSTSAKDIERAILKGVTYLIGQCVGSIEKKLLALKQQLRYIKPKIAVETVGLQLELEVTDKAPSPEVIREALLILEKMLKEKKQPAVMLLDEFQRVIEIAPDMGIEGGIRSAAQETQYLAIVFSGSSRHLIESIFQDEGRPLYKLCKKIRLDRISKEHYKKHLNKAARAMWKSELNEAVFQKIMQLTERHPYYVNYVCDGLWDCYEKVPEIEDVHKVWDRMVEEERSDLLREYFSISESQKKLLIYLANYPGESLYSAQAIGRMALSATSVPKALIVLLKKDLIEEYEQGRYRIINPVYNALLRNNS